jgi:uncharacterized repeat protein (TIGR01451 family)
MISRWLKLWTKRNARPQRHPELRRTIPAVECLEDRVVPVLFANADLQLLSLASASKTAVAGASESIVATIRNNGPTRAFSVKMSEHFGASLTGIHFTPSSGTLNAATGNWTGFSLAPGQTITLTATGIMNNAATGHLNASATISPLGVLDPNLSNNSLSTSVAISQKADLQVFLSDNSKNGKAFPGSKGVYTLIVFNAGPSAVKGATVTDIFPAGISSDTWTTTLHNGAKITTASGSSNINTTVDLLPGSFVVFTINVTISNSATGTVVNTASIASSVLDPNLKNNSAKDTLTITTT